MVSMLPRRWPNLAVAGILVALAIGPTGGFLHCHGTGSVDDHCAVCLDHHFSTIETLQSDAELQADVRILSPKQFDAAGNVLGGVHLSRGPPQSLSR